MRSVRPLDELKSSELDREFARLGWTGGTTKKVLIRRFIVVDGARDGAMVSNTLTGWQRQLDRPQYRPRYDVSPVRRVEPKILRHKRNELALKLGLGAAFLGTVIGSIMFIVTG